VCDLPLTIHSGSHKHRVTCWSESGAQKRGNIALTTSGEGRKSHLKHISNNSHNLCLSPGQVCDLPLTIHSGSHKHRVTCWSESGAQKRGNIALTTSGEGCKSHLKHISNNSHNLCLSPGQVCDLPLTIHSGSHKHRVTCWSESGAQKRGNIALTT
jgi:archaellum component FlaG (FlaF/FlaG flagellin family)